MNLGQFLKQSNLRRSLAVLVSRLHASAVGTILPRFLKNSWGPLERADGPSVPERPAHWKIWRRIYVTEAIAGISHGTLIAFFEYLERRVRNCLEAEDGYFLHAL